PARVSSARRTTTIPASLAGPARWDLFPRRRPTPSPSPPPLRPHPLRLPRPPGRPLRSPPPRGPVRPRARSRAASADGRRNRLARARGRLSAHRARFLSCRSERIFEVVMHNFAQIYGDKNNRIHFWMNKVRPGKNWEGAGFRGLNPLLDTKKGDTVENQ